jgi:2-oxoglutarate/2-oxoacid ferredoxin oxidoreductase subunit beta
MNISDLSSRNPTWCPGCGNYGLWAALKIALSTSGLSMENFVIVYGIGCSGNMTDFIKSHAFHSLHGRSIPNAIGIKLANHTMKVICIVGDGDCYGEGGNHFLHAIRGNHDITLIVHDNRVYGLTTGQTAPTSPKGFKSKSTPSGVIEYPINAPAIAILQGASFVAQGYAGDTPYLSSIFSKAISHHGFSLVNTIQPCVTFNKINTYQFYKERIYKLEDGYVPENKIQALERVMQEDKIPTGVIYKASSHAFHDDVVQIKDTPLVHQIPWNRDLKEEFLKFV